MKVFTKRIIALLAVAAAGTAGTIIAVHRYENEAILGKEVITETETETGTYTTSTGTEAVNETESTVPTQTNQ